MFDFLDKKADSTSTPQSDGGYDPDVTTKILSNFGETVDKLADNYKPSSVVGQGNSFGENPNYNFTDESTINKNQEAVQGFWHDAYNDFWQTWHSTTMSSLRGRLDYSSVFNKLTDPLGDPNNEGPQAIIDDYPDRIADLNQRLANGTIQPNEYATKKTQLDQSVTQAQKSVQDLQSQIDEQQADADKYPVSKGYKARQQVANLQGDAASIFDKAYTVSSTVGSSASMMLPSFIATFGNKLTQNMIKVAAANVLPVAGEVADAIGAVGALATSAAELIWNRANESYGEVDQAIQESRTNLVNEYMQQHGLHEPSQIPEDDMRKIRQQSRQGAKTQFNENMSLALLDIGEAVIMPLSNVGLGISKIAKPFKMIESAIEEASNYNKMTKLLSTAARFGTEAMGEKFEEGFQQAAQYRAEDANKHWNKDFFTKSPIINDILADGYDTAASLDYSLIPGITLRGTGKYSNDPEFQTAEESGGLLALGIGAIPTALSIRSDIKAYKAATQDLMNKGLLNADDKFAQLRNSVLKKYFDNDRVQYLAGALRSIVGKTDTDGNEIMSKSDADKLAKDIHHAYEVYQPLADQVDAIAEDKFTLNPANVIFGSGFFKNSNHLTAAKSMLKEDIFNAATSIGARKEALSELETEKASQLAKEIDTFDNAGEAAQADVEARKQAIKELRAIPAEGAQIKISGKYINWRDRILKDKLDELNQFQNENKDKLEFTPSKALQDIHEKIIANELYLQESQEKFSKLNKIRTAKDLYGYLGANLSRPISPNSELHNQLEDDKAEDELDMTDGVSDNALPANDEFEGPEDIQHDTPDSQVDTLDVANTSASTADPDDPAAEIKNEIGGILATPNKVQRASKFSQYFKDLGLDLNIHKTPLTAAVNALKNVYTPSELGNIYPGIKDAVRTLRPDEKEYDYDSNTGVLTIKQGVPPTQSSADDINNLNWANMQKLNNNEDDPFGTGLKVVNSLSIAWVGIEGAQYEDGQWKDDRGEDGKLKFNENDDQQLNNTNAVAVGDELTIRSITDLSITPANTDDIEIGIYKRITIGGVTREARVGYMPRLSSLENRLAESSDYNAEYAKLKATREAIINAGNGKEFTTTVASKGFGYLNNNRSTVLTTVGTAIGNDTRPLISIVDDNGRPEKQGLNVRDIQGVGFTPGSTIILLPNETKNGTEFIPMYLTKAKLGEDSAVLDRVTGQVEKFLTTGALTDLNAVIDDNGTKKFGPKAYLYITTSTGDLSELGRSGIFASTGGAGGVNITVGDKVYRAGDHGLKEALANIYFSANKKLLSSASYQTMMKKSKLLKTNITANSVILGNHDNGSYAFLKDNQQYQYFSQHTIEFAPIAQAEIVQTIEEVTELPNVQKADQALEDLGVVLDFDDISADDISANDSGIRGKLLVSADIPASLQTQMVDSIAYKLLTSTKEGEETNKNKVKAELEKIKQAIDTRYETSPDKTTKAALNAKKAGDNYKLLLDNYDKIVEKANTLLNQIGFIPDEDSDYYDSLQDNSEEDGFGTQFNEDGNSTRNPKEFLPTEVKKLIYFVPKLTMLGTAAEDKAIADKTGKMYKNAKNELGLDTFNNFNDTWEKVLAVTSNSFFESSKLGFNSMLSKLQDDGVPPVVQEVASKLALASDQVKRAFFSRTNLQEQKNVTFLHSISKFARKIFYGDETFNESTTRRMARTIRTDRKHAEKKVMEDMQNEFRTANTGILEIREDSGTGRDIFYVNANKAEDLRTQISDILANQNSFVVLPSKGRLAAKVTDRFLPEVKVQLYNIIRETGLNISFPAFNDLLRYYRTTGSETSGERVAMQEVFVNRILKTLSGESKNKSKHKTPDGYIELSRANPFDEDFSTMSSIAKQEFKYRKQWGSGAYRSADGKSYYAYTRHNYISEMFTRIKQGILDNTGDFVREKLANDHYASTSMWLEKLDNPAEKYFRSNFDLFYLLDARNEQSDNPAKQLKNMSEREHLITRLGVFQNQGKRKAMFLSDTMSDKVTKPTIEVEKVDISYKYVNNKMVPTGSTLDILYRYFENEYKRIQQVVSDNALFDDPKNGLKHKIVKGYNGENGMGKYFNNYYFLNKAFLDDENLELSTKLYNSDGTLKAVDEPTKILIRDAIATHISKSIDKTLKAFKDNDMYSIKLNEKKSKQGRVNPVTGVFETKAVYDVDLNTLADRDYIAGDKEFSALSRLRIPITKDLKGGFYGDLEYKQLLMLVHYIAADYTVNSIIASQETMMLTGDPAQAGKLADKDTIATIKDKYKDNPLKINKHTLLAHIQATFVNVSKRNAAFLASGERYAFDDDKYNVAIANDMAINSDHIEEYKARFPGNIAGVIKAYMNGDLTDAQEVTTVQEHLHVMKAAGKITDEMYKKALYIYDKDAYHDEFTGAPNIGDDDRAKLYAVVMQPMKPVQRTFVMDSESKMSKQFYIKTSSYPLIPSMVEGGPLAEMLREIKTNKVHRVVFVSGVKQGVAGAKDIFNKTEEGHKFNKSFFTNNINELPRSGFRIQLEVPYKQDKDHIREGTQQSKLLFVDIPDDLQLNYRDEKASVSDLKKKYINYHKKIVETQTDKLLKEITNRVTGKVDLRKLANILQDEGMGRGYALNSLLGLDLDSNGQFKIPLTFLPNAGQMEPVVTAIVSNRIAKLKMPGKSYVQGAEFILKMKGKRGDVQEGTDLDSRGIVWTKSEYKGLSKLQYMTKDHPAQVIMPFYFIKDGVKLGVEDYLDKETGLLDASRIDPELLQMNGFRIPFQGHNSGMWFEIVGFLPSEAGDLVLVPGEIAGQMGSDYDVDKLYSYMYNYYHKDDEGKINKIVERLGATPEEYQTLKRKANMKLVDQGVEPLDANTNFYKREDFNKALGEVVAEEYPSGDVPKHRYDKTNKEVTDKPVKSSKYEISKIDSDDPQSIEELQNAIIDVQKSIYTADHDSIRSAILEPQGFDDFKDAINEQGSEESSEFIGAFDPGYQMDVYFSNVTGKFGTAVGANANTSHAMAQTANLYTKGEGVRFLDENGNPYSDYTEGDDTNRVNKKSFDTYTYKKKEGNETINVDQNSKENNSAWRLDKIFTFDINPDTGKPYRISALISQVLGISVDNAKEQLLGAFGVNQLNLSVMLTITRAGFGFRFSKAFINQPILKQYYKYINETEDIYNIDYTPNKKQEAIDNLFKEYSKKFNIKSSIQDREGIQGFKLSELTANLGKEVDETNAEQQLEILKAFLRYKDMSDAVQSVSSAFNVDSKGLPQNMSETARKAESIDAILENQDVLGNVDKYAATTIPGLFTGIPRLAVRLFMNADNPVFAYGTAAYTNAKTLISYYTGKATLYDDQINTIHNHIKQYIYSGFDIDKIGRAQMPAFIIQERTRLLFDGETDSLQTRVLKLRELYPNSDLLSSIDILVSDNPDDPKLLNIQMSNEDDYVQKMSEHWDNMLSHDAAPELQAFAKDLVKYALWINPQEFGSSNIIKYIPFGYLEKIGFGEYLTSVHENLNGEIDPLGMQFIEQFIKHNNEFLPSVRETNKDGTDVFVPNSAVWQKELITSGETVSERNKVLDIFKLPAIDPNNVDKNPARGLVRKDDNNSKMYYPKYIRFYNDEQYKTQVYEGRENEDGTYTFTRVGNLGKNNVSEYVFGGKSQSNIDTNRPSVILPESNTGAVRSALGGVVAASNLTKEKTAFNYLKIGAKADSILTGIIDTANEIITDPASSKVDKAYAGLYQFLATRLHNTGLNGIDVKIDNNIPTSGKTDLTDGNIIVTINPSFAKRGRTGLSSELEQQRTILHEFIHAKVFDEFSKTGTESEDYKSVKAVWEAYKKAIVDNSDKGNMRGIPVNVLDAELLGVLKKMFNESKGSDIAANSFADFVSKIASDEEMINKILERTSHALALIPGLSNKNTDLISNKNRRDEFVAHLKTEFSTGEKLGDKINKYYAYHDIHEFFTEALTNRKLQGLLNRTPSIWQSFVNTIKNIIAKILGISSSERSLMDDAVDSVFKYIHLNKQEDIKELPTTTDKYKYYGREYEIVRDPLGKAIDVVGYKGDYAKKRILMDAYNNNPDADPQNGSYFRNAPTIVGDQPGNKDNEQQDHTNRSYVTPQGKKIIFNDQQYTALGQIKEWSAGKLGQFFTLAGYAGTGKTTIVNVAIKDLKKVVVSAPTHKAKAVIARATGRPAVTIQALLGLRPNTDIENFDINNPQFDPLVEAQIAKYRYVVIDEASMLNKDLFHLLIKEAEANGTKILFMGDSAQLPPVNEQESLVFNSAKINHKAELTKVERQANGNPLMFVYDAIRNNLSAAIDAFSHKTKVNNGQGITFISKQMDFEKHIEDMFSSEAYKQDKNYAKVLAWTNNKVKEWNDHIRQHLFGTNVRIVEPGDTLMGYNTIMKDPQAPPSLENSADYEVKSVTEKTDDNSIKIYSVNLKDVDGEKITSISIPINEPENMSKLANMLKAVYSKATSATVGKGAAWGAYYAVKNQYALMSPLNIGGTNIKKDVDYGYAITTHKSQGSTYKHVFVDENDIDRNSNTTEKNKLKYVAFSRPTDMVYSLTTKAEPDIKKVVRGDLFEAGRIPVITTNLEGIHGAGIAQLAKEKGLIKQYEGTFGGNKMAIRFPTKNTWREGASLDLMRDSFDKFISMANKNTKFNFAFPLAGLGHGGGRVEDIVPMIANMLRRTDNVTLVIPNEDTNMGKQAKSMQDKSKENTPAIIEALAKEGFAISSDDISAYSKENEVLGELMNRGIITIYC